FKPSRDLTKCSAAESASCFTPAQLAALDVVYDGVRTSRGELLFPGMPPAGEAFTTGRDGKRPSGLQTFLSGNFGLGDTFMKYMAFDEKPGASYDYRSF